MVDTDARIWSTWNPIPEMSQPGWAGRHNYDRLPSWPSICPPIKLNDDYHTSDKVLRVLRSTFLSPLLFFSRPFSSLSLILILSHLFCHLLHLSIPLSLTLFLLLSKFLPDLRFCLEMSWHIDRIHHKPERAAVEHLSQRPHWSVTWNSTHIHVIYR